MDVTELRILRRESILDYLDGADVITRVLRRGRQVIRGNNRRCDDGAETRVMGGRDMSQGIQVASRSSRKQGNGLSSEPPEGTSSVDTLSLDFRPSKL